MPNSEQLPPIGSPQWRALVAQADPITRSRLLEIERQWLSQSTQIDSGFYFAGIGLVAFFLFSFITNEWAIGAAIGGPIIAGGLLYAMRS